MMAVSFKTVERSPAISYQLHLPTESFHEETSAAQHNHCPTKDSSRGCDPTLVAACRPCELSFPASALQLRNYVGMSLLSKIMAAFQPSFTSSDPEQDCSSTEVRWELLLHQPVPNTDAEKDLPLHGGRLVRHLSFTQGFLYVWA